MDLPKLNRRPLLAGLLAAPFLAACSGDKPAPAPQATSSTTTTKAAPPKPAVTGRGLPADLLAVMTALYVGGTVPSAGAVATVLAKRKPLGKAVTVAGSSGSWKGTAVAVVTQGKDVTLLTKGKGWTVVGGWWPSLGAAAPVTPMRILVAGSDARPSQDVQGQRADALQIVGVDAKGVGGVVGIPRDAWVPLASGGSNKINAAMTFGGIGGLVKTVEGATGVPIDGYVLTGFKGFAGMINAMGGIRYVAAAPLKNERGQVLVKKGLNILGGGAALSFARERHMLPNGDFGRSANQGQLILAGMRMVAAGGAGAVVKYLTCMSPHLETDLSPSQVLVLATLPMRVPKASVRGTVAQGSVGERGGQSVVVLGSSAMALFRNLKDGRLNA